MITGHFFTKKVSLQIGEIAKETYYAPFQVENEVATNRKKDLAERAVEVIYKVDSKVQEDAISSITKLFDQIQGIKASPIDDYVGKTPIEILSSNASIALFNEQYETLLNTSVEELEYMKVQCIKIAGDVFSQGIRLEELNNRLIDIRIALEGTELSATKQKIAQDIIGNVLQPNVVKDEVATSEARKVARDNVDPIYVLAQEKIIEQGTRVTEEIYKLLEKVGYLETNKAGRYRQYLGIIIIMGLMCLLSFRYIKSGHSNKKINRKHLSLVLILYTLAIISARSMLGTSCVYLPLGIITMLVTFAMGIGIATVIHILLIIFGATIFKGDIVFILYFIIVGMTSILMASVMQERTKTTMNALIMGCIQAIGYLGLRLFIGSDITVTLITETCIAFIMGVISVIVVVGTLPMLESLFGFVTPMQLLELTNPNQPILKRLLIEATGTYYHSLLVANLAEAAADAIGANPLMARVGGYYHDIGKLNCSSYFKENQGLENPHDYMTPEESYNVIISHVTGGIKLAEEYNLPIYIKDMILQHHGTSTMQYFYIKAKKDYGEEIEEKAFQYPGPKPKTKEAALVMLADVVEATTRSMQEQLGVTTTIEELVKKMVKQKLKEGQLDDCELYISDIDKIIDSFTKMLKGIYHQRIQYPERNEK